MKNKPLLIFFFFVFSLKTFAQFLDKNYYLVDSLVEGTINGADRKTLELALKRYSEASNDTTRTQLLSKLVEETQDEKIWIKYNRLLYKKSVFLQTTVDKKSREYFLFRIAEALAVNNFGYYHFNYSTDYDKALKFYKEAMLINESVGNYEGLTTSYSNIANSYHNKGDLNEALRWYEKSLSLENKVSNKEFFLAPLNNMAQLYIFLNDTANSLKNLKKCFALSTLSGDKSMRAHLLNNIGVISYRSGDRSGLQSVKNALALRKQIGDKKGIVHSSLTLAGIFIRQGNFILAGEYIEDARKILSEIDIPLMEALMYSLKGDIAKKTGNHGEAVQFYERSVAIYKKVSMSVELLEVLEKAIKSYGNDKQYALKKLEAYELLKEVSEKVNKGNLQKLVMKQKYEDDLRVKEAVFKAEEKFREEKNAAEKRRQQYYIAFISVVLVLALGFLFVVYKAFTGSKKKNKIITEQKQLIEEKHKDITDSINYAQKIQGALIISEENLNRKLKEAFVIFKPRDIVSGDFYWFTEHSGYKIVALADCTGHGVPGAFMSMIGMTLLNKIVNEKNITSPARILNNLRTDVIKALHLNSDGADKRDGMDMALIAFNEQELFFSGANSHALIIHNGQITELKPNKQPIGVYVKNEEYTEEKISIQPGMAIYMYSDGIIDQFGGPGGKKVKSKQFKDWLLACSGLPLSQQKQRIEINLEGWKTGYGQTDDISVIGIKLG